MFVKSFLPKAYNLPLSSTANDVSDTAATETIVEDPSCKGNFTLGLKVSSESNGSEVCPNSLDPKVTTSPVLRSAIACFFPARICLNVVPGGVLL